MKEIIKKQSRLKEIYSYRWLNPWFILGDVICVIVVINLLLTSMTMFTPFKYGLIGVIMDLILIPIQLISYFILAPRWREKHKQVLLEWVKNNLFDGCKYSYSKKKCKEGDKENED